MIARLVLAAALAAALTPSAAAAAEAPKVAISFSQQSLDQLPLWIALDAGYFEAHGLDVTEELLSSQQGIPALFTGQVQMTSIGAGDSLAAAAQGVQLKYVAAYAPDMAFQLWARPEYGSAQKLRGEKVAVPSPTGTAYTAMVTALGELGLKSSDVVLTQTGTMQNSTASLFAGSVAAGIAIPPTTYAYKKRGFVMLMDLLPKKIPNVTTGLVVLDSYLGSHRAIIAAAVAAFAEGLKRERDDRAFTEQEIHNHIGTTGQAALDDTYDFFRATIWQDEPMPTTAMLATSRSVLGLVNPKVKAVDLGSLIDQSFVQTIMAQERTKE